MTDYRLYCLDGAGKITSAEWVAARDDAEAILAVRSKKLPMKCELWDRDRHVATIAPRGES